MTNALADCLEDKSPAASVSPTSLALWLLVQLTATALIVARVKFWIGGGRDADAVELLLVMQIAAAGLLFPSLLPNWRTSVCVLLSAIPFLQIAGVIAAIDPTRVVAGAIALALWLSALSMAHSLARSAVARAAIHALVVCVSIGGVVMSYLRAEFVTAPNTIDAAWFGPICAALTLVRGETSSGSIRVAWTQLGAIAITVLVIWVAKRVFVVADARSR